MLHGAGELKIRSWSWSSN